MNKSKLASELSKQANVTKKHATEVVNLVFDKMTDALSNGERIEIRGFGSFTVRRFNEYNGRNPKTGEEVKVLAKKVPFFKVGKELKRRVDY
ncbi:MAG: HU family DNA-binding protein [Thermodesulfobacteriota bacterium]|nr:HU family DNA-binding protein [Thermodesulfobacteriota bacterium]